MSSNPFEQRDINAGARKMGEKSIPCKKSGRRFRGPLAFAEPVLPRGGFRAALVDRLNVGGGHGKVDLSPADAQEGW